MSQEAKINAILNLYRFQEQRRVSLKQVITETSLAPAEADLTLLELENMGVLASFMDSDGILKYKFVRPYTKPIYTEQEPQNFKKISTTTNKSKITKSLLTFVLTFVVVYVFVYIYSRYF